MILEAPLLNRTQNQLAPQICFRYTFSEVCTIKNHANDSHYSRFRDNKSDNKDEDVDEELSNISILVRHRKVKSLMEEAEKYKDLTMEQACHDSEGEVLDSEVHVEIKMEKISKNGKRTVGIHRIIPYSKFEFATISLIRDWEVMLREVSQDVPKDSYYDNSATAFIDLDE